ncbi:PLDc N-terminal domain-containing protein [Pilimelia columellifera]|uniref:Cardiolipin synthase N-terminal domain-containing protein n=1 Tax=Pilimelia columellifera subsp. columellifera TaxID=706583 RepID=A0ABP6B161_9ACTN
MSHLSGQLLAASDTGTTIAGIGFWIALIGVYVALILFVLSKILRAPLTQEQRTRWVWFVFLAPMLGIICWFTVGQPKVGGSPERR